LDYVLGMDGGGTKTVCVISDIEGRLLGGGVSGPSNYLTVGEEEAKRSMRIAIEKALEKCRMDIPKFKIAYLGMAGAGRSGGVAVFKRLMESLELADKVFVDTDAAIALAGATTGNPGVVLISGTGSVAFGINKDGEKGRVGGWGYLIGDEGSGFDIGRKGLAAVFRAYDGRGKETVLLDRLMSHFKVKKLDEIIDIIYSDKMKVDVVSSLAPLIVEAAREGDAVSQKILMDTVKELSLIAITLIRRLNMENEEFELVLLGGIFKVKDLIADPVQQNIVKVAPKCRAITPRFKPAVGAVLMALKEMGVEISEYLLESIRTTIHNIQEIL